jgi:hypothetical protein
LRRLRAGAGLAFLSRVTDCGFEFPHRVGNFLVGGFR